MQLIREFLHMDWSTACVFSVAFIMGGITISIGLATRRP